jgi:hypothetical protein
MAERPLKITITGEDKGGAKALAGVKKAGDDLVPSVDKANKALGQITSALTSHLPVGGAQAKAALDKVSSSATEGAKELSGVGAAALGVAAVGGAALAKFASDGIGAFVSATAETRKLKAAMGSTAEEASELRNVGKSLGVDVDTLAKGFVNFDKKLGESQAVLKTYGVEIATNKQGHIDQFQTLLNLGDAYKKIQDPVEKNIFLTTAFGKAGADLRPILSANREELEKFAKSGVIFNDDQLQKGKEFALAQRNLNLELEKLKVNVGASVVPEITKLTTATVAAVDWTDQHTKRAGGLTGVFKSFLSAATPVAGIVDLIASHHKKGADAAKEQADEFGALADSVAADTGVTDQNALSQIRNAKSVKEAGDAANAAVKAYEAMYTAQERLISTSLGLENAQVQVKKAEDDVKDATDDLNTAIRDHGANSKEAKEATEKLADAERGLKGDVVGLAGQMRDQRVTQLEATGATVDAAQKADLFKQSLQQLAANVKEPLRSQLLGLAADIKSLPDNKRITLEMSTDEARAALQRFIIDAQNDLIRSGLANVNTAAYKAAEAQGFSDSGGGGGASGPSEGYATYHDQNIDRYALGGWVRAPKGKPKLAIVHGGEYVVSADEMGGGGTYAGGPWNGTGGGTGGGTVVLEAPVYLDGREITRATWSFTLDELRRHIGRNGGSI